MLFLFDKFKRDLFLAPFSKASGGTTNVSILFFLAISIRINNIYKQFVVRGDCKDMV